jgi:hypothetical protein
METYSTLLTQAIASIQGGEAAAAETSVFDFGGYANPFADQQADDFELVSFLVFRA